MGIRKRYFHPSWYAWYSRKYIGYSAEWKDDLGFTRDLVIAKLFGLVCGHWVARSTLTRYGAILQVPSNELQVLLRLAIDYSSALRKLLTLFSSNFVRRSTHVRNSTLCCPFRSYIYIHIYHGLPAKGVSVIKRRYQFGLNILPES